MRYQHWLELFSSLNEIDQATESLIQRRVNQEGVTLFRQTLIQQLEQLKEGLAQSLDDLSVHHILFALIAMLDEEIQLELTKHGQPNWLPIQQNFFETSIAGDVFFKTLDDLLDDQKTPSIVYEVIYFVLKRGFRGRYLKSPSKILNYMNLLADKIPSTTTMTKASEEAVAPLTRVLIKPWHYYAMTSIFTICVYCWFYAKSNYII